MLQPLSAPELQAGVSPRVEAVQQGKDDEEGDLNRVGTISYQRNKATTSIEGIHTVDTWTLCWLPTVCLVCMSGSSCTVRALALSGLLSGHCARGILWLCLQNTRDAVCCSCWASRNLNSALLLKKMTMTGLSKNSLMFLPWVSSKVIFRTRKKSLLWGGFVFGVFSVDDAVL